MFNTTRIIGFHFKWISVKTFYMTLHVQKINKGKYCDKTHSTDHFKSN